MQTDVANLRAALAARGSGIAEAFMNAASPGVISAFQSNRYYPTHDAYVDAIEGANGFWEEAGYHMYGDPWREQRYQDD